MHHGGKWTSECGMEYNGGNVSVFNDIPDCVSMSYLKDLISSLGHKNIMKLHYADPRKDFNNGIRFLCYNRCTFDPFSIITYDLQTDSYLH